MCRNAPNVIANCIRIAFHCTCHAQTAGLLKRSPQRSLGRLPWRNQQTFQQYNQWLQGLREPPFKQLKMQLQRRDQLSETTKIGLQLTQHHQRPRWPLRRPGTHSALYGSLQAFCLALVCQRTSPTRQLRHSAQAIQDSRSNTPNRETLTPSN